MTHYFLRRVALSLFAPACALGVVKASSVTLGGAQMNYARARTDQDSMVLVNYLRARKERLRRVAAHSDSLWVVVSGRDREQLVLHYLKISSGKVIPLHAPDSIGTFIPNEIRWVSLGDLTAPFGLLVREEYPSAGVIGSSFLRLDLDSLATVFKDNEQACRAAEIERLQPRRNPVLIVYEGDLSGGICDSNCHMRIEERFHATLAWPHVLAWQGNNWADAERSAESFYLTVAHNYQRVADWMDSKAGKEACPESWASSARVREWSARAESIATSRRQ